MAFNIYILIPFARFTCLGAMLAMRLIGELQIVLQVIQETHGIQMESLCSGYRFVRERKEVVSPILLPIQTKLGG
jgi:hypothetical protein